MVVLSGALIGLLFSLLIVMRVKPAMAPCWRWQWRGLLLHVGCWLVVFSVLVLLLGRPWFAMAAGLALLLVLVEVNNAKFHSLREPFVYQDFEYFTDAIRHPRLYIPFLGWSKAILIAFAALLAVMTAWLIEAVLPDRWVLGGSFGQLIVVLVGGMAVLWWARPGPAVQFIPAADIHAAGLIGALWGYGVAERQVPVLPEMFDQLNAEPVNALPNVVVVQSESFFDPRRFYDGVDRSVLDEFDRFCAEAISCGPLDVPAWGANTVRSEFAFLTGLPEQCLGVHRFNPFRVLARKRLRTLAHALRDQGYRTVCVHPYAASFYGRETVYPNLGFDEFVDIRAFGEGDRAGPYIGDEALARKMEVMLEAAHEPLFIFAITMENHGPLHLETVQSEEASRYYQSPPPVGCDELTIYLRHLSGANRMLKRLREAFARSKRTACLAWYGDHVPIMPKVYRTLGEPSGTTDYFVWRSDRGGEGLHERCAVSSLGEKVFGMLRHDG